MEIVKCETIRKSENLFEKQWHITLRLNNEEIAMPRKAQREAASELCKKSNIELSDIFWFPKYTKRKDGLKIIWTHYKTDNRCRPVQRGY
jgi:hypothetical protein